MAKNQTKRLNPDLLKADVDSLAALAEIKTYHPANPAFTVEADQTLKAAIDDAQAAEAVAEAALKTARDLAVAAEWAFHNAILGSKDQVSAQYGKDSNEYQSLGMKKKSEYKSPGRKSGK